MIIILTILIRDRDRSCRESRRVDYDRGKSPCIEDHGLVIR